MTHLWAADVDDNDDDAESANLGDAGDDEDDNNNDDDGDNSDEKSYGWVGGRCFLGRVAEGEAYVFFVHVYKEEVYCLSDNTLLANDKLLRDLSEVNHTTMLYPIGVHEQMNLQHRCPKMVVPLPERYREENEETFNSVEQSRPHEKRSSGKNTQTQVPAIILVLFLSVIFFYL
ncbi:hypothetical protein HELRODRAFT_190483 [Helobdella robusta]|uniref:Uncharacterized protein n=1 Tax=Helobdella robusta TaxID=6412 RepID=T1FS10_HELRO|nr:hypothetical protein HELRODRAFT_190483 [Helobdella robusta]ESO09401.1 hypothetical protein HELRODRAFT_190483 [Helobdella robusta]